MPSSFLDRVRETIRRHGMLRGGETVLVGVSGGPDSVCLFHCLRVVAPSFGLGLRVLHVHHGLRPEADAEANFVLDLARAWDVPVAVERGRQAGGEGLSPEAAARRFRYAAFRRWAARLGASRVALGHSADDQAETVLMRVLEGAGPRGLGGIPPVRGLFIRPLIGEPRSAILGELERAGHRWVEDRSNRDPKFLRNRIRHDLLPLLAGSYNPRVAEALCRVGALARDLVTDLEVVAQRELDRVVMEDGDGLVLPVDHLRALPPVVVLSLLRVAAARLGEHAPLRGWSLHALRGLVDREGSRGQLSLGRVRVERGPTQIRLAPRGEERLPERSLPVPGSVELPEARLHLRAQSFLRPPEYRIAADPWTAVFDADSVPAPMTVRSRRRGDRFRPFGAPGSKPLRKFLIDVKVPRWKRDRVPLVVAGEEILWVVGVRRGGLAAVTAATRRVLEITAVRAGRPGSPLGAAEGPE